MLCTKYRFGPSADLLHKLQICALRKPSNCRFVRDLSMVTFVVRKHAGYNLLSSLHICMVPPWPPQLLALHHDAFQGYIICNLNSIYPSSSCKADTLPGHTYMYVVSAEVHTHMLRLGYLLHYTLRAAAGQQELTSG